MTDRFREFWQQHAEWSQATFGTDQERGPLGALKHLEKEAREAQTEALITQETKGNNKSLAFEAYHEAQGKLREEIADCLFLTIDAARRAGMTHDTLLDEAFKKLEINKKRVWQKPTSADQPIEHVRD